MRSTCYLTRLQQLAIFLEITLLNIKCKIFLAFRMLIHDSQWINNDEVTPDWRFLREKKRPHAETRIPPPELHKYNGNLPYNERPRLSHPRSINGMSQDYTVLLPPETLLHIASYIDKPSDLISLAHTNSTLRSYAVARLYARICLYRWSAKTIDVLDHLAKYSLQMSLIDIDILT